MTEQMGQFVSKSMTRVSRPGQSARRLMRPSRFVARNMPRKEQSTGESLPSCQSGLQRYSPDAERLHPRGIVGSDGGYRGTAGATYSKIWLRKPILDLVLTQTHAAVTWAIDVHSPVTSIVNMTRSSLYVLLCMLLSSLHVALLHACEKSM